jgi:hypothetical protein
MILFVVVFLGILCPPINCSVAVFAIENFFYHHEETDMDYSYTKESKNLPSLGAVLGCFVVSTAIYMFICWGMPFDWIFIDSDQNEHSSRVEDGVVYPVDDMSQDPSFTSTAKEGKVLLAVDDISHIYPDGTHAVKGIGFNVHEGEVLSYLGANGAGTWRIIKHKFNIAHHCIVCLRYLFTLQFNSIS